jgi:LCP family protein required for cell wall assembly
VALPPHLDPRGRRSTGRRVPAAARRVGLSVLGVLSVVALVLAGYAYFTYRSIDKNIPRFTGGFKPRAAQTAPDFDGSDQNLLVVGNDDRSNLSLKEARELKVGKDGGSLATDSMMIIHVPADGSRATLISLPRDSYVRIPGYGMNKLNSAYAMAYGDAKGNVQAKRTAGAEKLTQTVSNLTGLTIDHFIQVTLLGFVQISDAVGGVTVNLCNAVNDTVAANRAAGEDGGSGLVLSAGKHTIKGVVALEFVRQRHGLPNGDLDRTARQRYFLTQAFRKVVSAGTLINPSRISSLADAVESSIYVDNDLSLTDLARQVATLSPNDITGKAIPFENFADTEVGSVEIVKPAKVKAFVHRLIQPPAAASTTSEPKPATSGASGTSGSKKPAVKKTCIN